MSSLETLLRVYPTLLLLNAVVALTLWFFYRRSLFTLLIGVWISTLINFVAQGIFIESPLGSIIAFSTYIITAWFLFELLAKVIDKPLSFKPYWIIYSFALCTSILANHFGHPFTFSAVPVAIAVALPQIQIAIAVLRTNGISILVKMFALVLIVNGLHFIDYPFLRPIPNAALFGFSLVIANSMLFGVLLPCIINNFLTDELTNKLKEEVKSHLHTMDELAIALETSEQSSKAKTVFLANVSHHLRTPINGIMGLNDLLIESDLTQEQIQWTQQVRNSSNALLRLVDNILTSAELESGKVNVHIHPLCIQQFINELVDYYDPLIATDPRLKIQSSNTHPLWIQADIQKLRQVCINLIDNAFKHSQAKNISLNIFLNDDKNHLHIELIDDGKGVNRDRLTQLAQAFSQETKSLHCGTGLGLSISRALIILMGGNLEINSEEGVSFSVHCHIPIKLTDGFAIPPTNKTRAIMGEPVEIQNKLESQRNEIIEEQPKALVVEDNPINRMVLIGMLKKLHIDAYVAEDGAQAESLYQQHKNSLSCIFMDVQLPDANGLDIVAQIRKIGDHIPILVISAFGFGDDEARAIDVGANAYLRKPYHLNELKSAIEQIGLRSLLA